MLHLYIELNRLGNNPFKDFIYMTKNNQDLIV